MYIYIYIYINIQIMKFEIKWRGLFKLGLFKLGLNIYPRPLYCIYLQRLFTHFYSNYNLSNSERKLDLPKPRTNYLKRSFSYSGATLGGFTLDISSALEVCLKCT